MKKESNEGLTVKKENFSEWYSQIIDKAELVDIRLDMKGFMVIRPWGARIIENMYKIYEKELQERGHEPTFMPSVIPEANLKKESSHIKGFTPEVFWLKEINKEKLALRPTSETLYTPMFKLWIRSHRDLPLKLYQRGSVFRLDTKATRPLIRTREILWIECHDAFATKKEAEKQVQEDIEITEKVMHQKFGIPFLAMKRPSWDKFAGAEYTIGSDVLMPDGKLIQQPSTHLMGQKFSKAFDAKFKTENGKEEYLWTTAYGPAMSRILVSVISMHGDDKGLILPFSLSPVSVIIVPIFTTANKEKILKYAEEIKNKLKDFEIKIDDRDFYTPGWKFHEWELKGVPFRIEIGEKELKAKTLTLFIRDTGKKEIISLKKFPDLKKLGEQFDERLRKNAEKMMEGRIVNCKTAVEIKKAVDNSKIAKVNWCSLEEAGIKCAESVEKSTGAEIRGTLANKNEKPLGKCIICGKKANEVVYIGKSY
ncbi:MAG: proline--tRNA ligase [Candidatus Pacearchaeota archaeon]|nr:proline--tRNA ligase [Candidatus Pacearchaeota archaeon]